MNFITLMLSMVVTLSVVPGCYKPHAQSSKTVTLIPGQVHFKNIPYGKDAAQKMDIYLPANRNINHTNVVIFIHGGGWSGGDKSEFNNAISSIRERLGDYAIFNINYRLAGKGKNKYPAQLQDVQSAIDFIALKAKDYHVNANKIALVGASAGAHLAMLQAYKNNDERIKAVIDLFGPTDLKELYYHHPIPAASQPALVNLLASTPSGNPRLYNDVNPLNYITPLSVPTKIFHGALDYIVPVAHAYMLKDKLAQNGIKADLTVYKNEGHGWYGPDLQDTFNKTVSFIQQNVN